MIMRDDEGSAGS